MPSLDLSGMMMMIMIMTMILLLLLLLPRQPEHVRRPKVKPDARPKKRNRDNKNGRNSLNTLPCMSHGIWAMVSI